MARRLQAEHKVLAIKGGQVHAQPIGQPDEFLPAAAAVDKSSIASGSRCRPATFNAQLFHSRCKALAEGRIAFQEQLLMGQFVKDDAGPVGRR
ncbi:MAG: hypothetical protein R2864_05800 [Syntrophotaleaceae bacterium]